jgi:hypothetical protein
MRQQASPAFFARFWEAQFSGQIQTGVAVPEALSNSRLELEGNDLIAVEVGHTDTFDTTILQVPSLGLVVAGDVAYNDIHPFLVESDHARRSEWVAALDTLEWLRPRAVIAGYKRPGRADDPRIIEETR